MRKGKATGAARALPLAKIAAIFLGCGLFLFLHVWLPVQAERSRFEQKQLEAQLSRKKSELNDLNERYAALTALPVLDQWAKKHGPWVAPNANNVIAIEE